MFKHKIISQIKSKPKQDLRSFLKNFENLMLQHKTKMMKTSPIDQIEQNYQYLLVWILYVLHDEHAFECQILHSIKHLKLEKFDQIKNSLVIMSSLADLEEVKEQPPQIDRENYVECMKMVAQKAVDKLSRSDQLSMSNRPQNIKTLKKDIDNQINNIKGNKNTTAEHKEILESSKDFANKILNIFEELNLISTRNTDSKGKSIEYYENLRERFEEAEESGQLDEIINKQYAITR